MKKFSLCILSIIAAMLLAFGCGGGPGVTPDVSSIVVTISPADGTADVALNVTVTAAFSAAITEPSDWTAVFTLKKDNAGDSLCTDVTYDSDNLIATCAHENLEVGGSYSAAVSGVKDTDENEIATTTATFTTSTAEASVLSFTRTSVTSPAAGNDVEITFDFGASAVPEGLTPTVEVTGSSPSVGDCSFNASRTAYTCIVSDVDGCTTLTDYSVTLGGNGFSSFSTTFNSADDEFEWSNSIISDMIGAVAENKCWIGQFKAGTSKEIVDGALNMTLSNAGLSSDGLYKQFAGDFAYSMYIVANDRPASGTTGIALSVLQNADDNTTQCFVSGKVSSVDTWALARNLFGGTPAEVYAKPAGDLGDTATHKAPFYVCLVKHNDRIKYYIATEEGSPYTEVTIDDLTCFLNCTDVADILDTDVSAWNEISAFLGLLDNADDTYTAQFGYVRYKATGLTGTVDDCPPIP